MSLKGDLEKAREALAKAQEAMGMAKKAMARVNTPHPILRKGTHMPVTHTTIVFHRGFSPEEKLAK